MSVGAPTLRELLGKVPNEPGVYLWKDAADRVLYVGKAKELRKRMRNYLRPVQADRPAIEQMMPLVTSFDFVVTRNEVESLILEANLIKEYQPPYNVNFRDDKSYPFIALTMDDPFPGIKYTREKHRRGTRYFGPYTDARAARETVDVVRRVYPICHVNCLEWKRVNARGGEPTGKPCFDHHIGKCPGPCVGAVTQEDYRAIAEKVALFLEGRTADVADELERGMDEAAANLDYETAARLRNRLDAVRKALERQTVVSARRLDIDAIGLVREETIAGVYVLLVRDGRVLAGNEFVLDKGLDVPEPELIEGFLLRYYGQASHVPKEVLVPCMPDGAPALEDWLATLRGARVRLAVPARGEKRTLADLSATNAGHALNRYKNRVRYDEERCNRALLELESALSLPAPPLRIEAFDISTLHGTHSVGSMVVFCGGRPDSSQYRRFRIRMPAEESNDVAMMAEMLRRRFARAEEGAARPAAARPDGAARSAGAAARFASRPDLVIVDGGKPQLGAAAAALRDAGVGDIPLAALAKREEELFLPGAREPVVLPAGAASLHLLKRVRDEAHRFAVTYHRELRAKAMTASVLDEIEGIGPKRKKALLKAFGSVRRLREASASDMAAAVPGVTGDLAREIVEFLRAAAGE